MNTNGNDHNEENVQSKCIYLLIKLIKFISF